MKVAKLTKYEGRRVEVCSKENGFGSIWYKAIIKTTQPKSRRSPFCVRLLKDDFATPFTKLSDNVRVRPVPPVHVEAQIDVKEGCVVDASRNDEWWSGLLIKVILKDKCLVFFDSPVPDVIQFERKDLRPHLDWVDEKWWVVKEPNLELLECLTKDSMFSSGTMVEVKVNCMFNKVEVDWVPGMIVKEFEEVDKEIEDDDFKNEESDEETDREDDDDDDEEENEEIEEIEKKFIVKFCDKSLSCKDNKASPNKTVSLHRIRPTPPSFRVEEYQLREYVEAFCGMRWRQVQVIRFLSEKRYVVHLKAANGEVVSNHSNLRPLKVWEDGVWKTKELSLTQAASGNQVGGSVTNAKVSGPRPLKQAEAEPSKCTTYLPIRNQNGLENDATRENGSSEDNNRKRKRDEYLGSNANDSAMVLPFEKKLPIWETVESMEVFKTVPGTPHFRPLVETPEESREMCAIGLMFTYSALVEKVRSPQLFTPVSTLVCLSDFFAKLEKHGFDVKAPQSRIQKLLSLKDRQAKKMEELKGIEKEIAESEQKILELQRKKEKVGKELEDVELQL